MFPFFVSRPQILSAKSDIYYIFPPPIIITMSCAMFYFWSINLINEYNAGRAI